MITGKAKGLLNCIAKPALEAWKLEQAIYAALTLPRLPNEPLDAFARRVAADMDSQSDTAKSFGSKLHKQIEQELSGMEGECIRVPERPECN